MPWGRAQDKAPGAHPAGVACSCFMNLSLITLLASPDQPLRAVGKIRP